MVIVIVLGSSNRAKDDIRIHEGSTQCFSDHLSPPQDIVPVKQIEDGADLILV